MHIFIVYKGITREYIICECHLFQSTEQYQDKIPVSCELFHECCFINIRGTTLTI